MRSALLVLLTAAIALSCAASSPPPALTTSAAPGDLSKATPTPADLAAPGPAAAPCTDDKACGAHRCNVVAGKCAFPCATDADCAPGASCNHGAVGLCVARP